MQSATFGQAQHKCLADDRGQAPCRSSWAQPSASEIQAILVLNIPHPTCSRRRGAPSLTTRSQSASRYVFRRPLVVERTDMQNQAKDVRQDVDALCPRWSAGNRARRVCACASRTKGYAGVCSSTRPGPASCTKDSCPASADADTGEQRPHRIARDA